ncbi:DUF6090 family protein [Croceivirga thetidis]|uniref:Uncharacterized protein n=1 Tax=Croceivirga thetidis TaxID=2721623 RepID=A0ABX1GLZ4_9FLAO|nr:DUF6090 family protein [Croceivirga thetidis]NKI30932.1 hypothetical protein [Croceivirga thetidis]
MLKFFRRIRQKLLQENRFSKYLLYAIGEIVLVMIGILLALQINNWNENLKARKEEQRILKLLKDEVSRDISLLENLIESGKRRGAEMDSLMIMLANKQNYDVSNFLRLSYSSLGFEGHFKSSAGTYEESLAAGSIKSITNETLRQKIFSYYGDVKLNYTDKNAQKIIYESIYPVFFKKIMATNEALQSAELPSRLKPIDLMALGKDPEFMAMIIQKRTAETFQIFDWGIFLEKATELHKEINQEIEHD